MCIIINGIGSVVDIIVMHFGIGDRASSWWSCLEAHELGQILEEYIVA